MSKMVSHALLWCWGLTAGALAQDFSIDWSTVDGGGGTSSGGSYGLTSTIGQPDAGPPVLAGGIYEITAGFWVAPAQDCNDNGVSDGAEIAAGTSGDCNANGTPDDCELAGDGVPAGFALEFDGVNDHLVVPSHPDLRPANNFTIEAWINPQQIGTSQNLIQHDEDGGGDDGYTLNLLSDGRVRFAASNANGLAAQSAVSDQTLTPDEWYHLAGVYHDSVVKVYVDGQETSHVASGDVVYTVFDNLNIGRRGGTNSPNTSFFNGLMDEVRFWNVPRSQAEIVAGMHVALSGSEPGLVGYWRFDEGSGSTFFDSAGTHHGALVNEPAWVEAPQAGSSNDCNANGALDECDLAGGASLDLNMNGIPDECDRFGDYDGDGYVDLVDFAELLGCLSGPGGGLDTGCAVFDRDDDGDVDLSEFSNMQSAFTGTAP